MKGRDRLIELIKKALDKWESLRNDFLDEKIDNIDPFRDVLADYLLANGVIVPTFKVGDTVWYITGIHRTLVKSAIVEEIIINSNGVSDLYVKNDMGGYFENSVDIFYKTKEEAEEKLRELKDNA